MKDYRYPLIIGGGRKKQAIGVPGRNGRGWDVYIMDADLDHEYAQISFCTKEALHKFIGFLEDVERLWEKTENGAEDMPAPGQDGKKGN